MKLEASELPPPGGGLVTVTFRLPAIATPVAKTAAESWVALMKVVVSGLPLKLTTDFATKFAPFIVSESATARGVRRAKARYFWNRAIRPTDGEYLSS